MKLAGHFYLKEWMQQKTDATNVSDSLPPAETMLKIWSQVVSEDEFIKPGVNSWSFWPSRCDWIKAKVGSAFPESPASYTDLAFFNETNIPKPSRANLDHREYTDRETEDILSIYL